MINSLSTQVETSRWLDTLKPADQVKLVVSPEPRVGRVVRRTACRIFVEILPIPAGIVQVNSKTGQIIGHRLSWIEEGG